MINNERVPEKSDPNLTKFYVPTISKELLYGPSLLWKVCHSRISLSTQLMNTPPKNCFPNWQITRFPTKVLGVSQFALTSIRRNEASHFPVRRSNHISNF